MSDHHEGFPAPVADPQADGLPETADDDSGADLSAFDGRDPAPLPPERENGPLGLDEFGTSAGVGLRGESLDRRLRRERPDARVRLDPDERLADEADPDALAQVGDDSLALAQDAAVPARLDSAVSVFDRAVTGIPLLVKVGRLVRPDEGGLADDEADEVAYDAGLSGGGPSAEESAMHVIRTDADADTDSDADSDAR